MFRNVRGALVRANRRPVGQLVFPGRTERLIFRVKTGCREHRRAFAHACRVNGLDATRLEYVDDANPADWAHTTAFDVTGTVEGLVACNELDCVVESHAAIGIRLPFRNQGSGPEKRVPRVERPRYMVTEPDADFTGTGRTRV